MTVQARAQALGDRAVALANSDHNVVVTGDLVLGTEKPGSDVLLLARALGELAPRCLRRARPLTRPPAPEDDRVDREGPIEELRRALAGGRCVSLFGDEGVGKSYVLRAAIEGTTAHDGTVWIDGAERPADDVLQAVFEQLYDAHPIVATREQRRGLLAGLRALVAVENPREQAGDAEQIRTELPVAALALATRAPAGWGGSDARIELRGLDPDHALTIIFREMGELDADQRRAATELISQLRGNPRRLATWRARRSCR